MNSVKIVSSKHENSSIVVTWSDNMHVYFKASDVTAEPIVGLPGQDMNRFPGPVEYNRRVEASRIVTGYCN